MRGPRLEGAAAGAPAWPRHPRTWLRPNPRNRTPPHNSLQPNAIRLLVRGSYYDHHERVRFQPRPATRRTFLVLFLLWFLGGLFLRLDCLAGRAQHNFVLHVVFAILGFVPHLRYFFPSQFGSCWRPLLRG